MNVLGQDIDEGTRLVLDDGTHAVVSGGNGTKVDNTGRAIYAYPVNPDTGEHIGSMIRVDGQIDVEATQDFWSGQPELGLG